MNFEINECEICEKVLNNDKYKMCYNCFQEYAFQCSGCDKMLTDQRYTKCYTCSMKGKIKCPKCPKMRDPKYKMCYSCLKGIKT